MKNLALTVMLGVLWVAGNLQAEIEDNIIPIVGREFRDHYSLQLRGLSLEAEGELCEIYVWDSTCDSSAYGEITITNLEDSSTIFHRRYDIPYDYYNPGGFGEMLILPYNTVLQINIRGQEFSHFSAIFGDEIVAHGSAYHGEYPNWTDTLTIQEGPYISNIEPSSGAPGIDVTIKGFGFPANPWVNFDGIPRPVESWSENEVVVKVPPGKGVVDVYVTVMTGWPKSNPVKFTYKDPVINEIDPSSGRPGEKITIKGSDFGGPDPSPVIGDLFVKFGKSRSRLITWTDKELVVEAPWDYGLGVTEDIILWLLKLIVSGWTGIPPEFLDPISDLIVELSNAGVEIREGEGTIILGVYVENTAGRKSNTERFTFYVPEIILALLRSPGELMVHDSQGNVTGLVDGEIKEEIAYSYCADNNVLIAYPSDSYMYEVVGTENGLYGLSIISASDGEEITFEAADIPTSPGARHVYAVDWQALSSGEEGVVLEIDNNGDGVFEQMVIADNELSSDEFALQTETVIDFDPDTLNLKSKGKFVTVYIELPDDFDVSDIDVFSLELNELVPPLPKPIEIGDYDSDGTNDLMVKFDLQELIEVLEPGEQMIDITGRLWDGRPIAGFDIIRVIH